jgi:histone H3/H4
MSQFFSSRGVRRALEYSSPGHFTQKAVDFYGDFLEELTRDIIPDARELAASAGKKRVDADDIKLAAKRYVHKSG